MPFSGNHVLLAWGGSMPGGEKWTNTLRMRDNSVPLAFPTQDAIADWLAGGFKTALATFWGVVDNFIGTSTKLEWMKANAVGTDGKYLSQVTNIYTWAAPLPGLAGYEPPNQSAIAVSTATGLARGRAHIGRFFLPAIGIPLDPVTGTFSAANATTIATGAAVFIKALNTTANDPGPGYALKAAVMSNLGDGIEHDITGARVGRVVDTQRRRRNKIAEAPVLVPLP